MPCRDSGLPHDALNIVMGTSGNVFERQAAGEGAPSALFQNLKEFGIMFSRIET